MSSKYVKNNVNQFIKYELLPPDGGWGYLITIAVALLFNVTFIPMGAFGLIYGNFLSTIGDETTGTAITNGIFNTVFNFTGLITNHLLAKYSYRFVAILGSGIFFIGHFSIIFVDNLVELVTAFGIIQGIGMGLLIPSFFSALNSYFDKRLNLMNSISQSVMVIASILMPSICQFLMNRYGFRGTVAILSAASLNAFVASAILQPVEWHMKKREIQLNESLVISLENLSTKDNDDRLKTHIDPLLEKPVEDRVRNEYQKFIVPQQRSSIISMGDRAMSVTTINRLGQGKNEEEKMSLIQSLMKSMNLELFKDPIYLNISFGLSLSFTADIAFISIIPLLMFNAGFDSTQTTLLLTVHFMSDLAARILLSVLSAFIRINNRLAVLAASFLSAVFRTVFVMGNSFYWKLTVAGILGFLRCFIQTPLTLVIADEYSDNFSTAFSLYMVVCGCVSLVFGPLMSFVKSVTGSDEMVVHVLSLAYLTCSITWVIEICYKNLQKKNKSLSK